MNYNFINKLLIKNDERIIPLNIFQTWHTLNLPLDMKQNVELLKMQNTEFKHFLYDDAMCREFIKNNFDENVLYTFDKLSPGAYKADLWRYCILYIHGGIYLDIKYHCVNNFKLIKLTNKEYYVNDLPYCGVSGIYNALLACKSNNVILHKCIYKIVELVKNNSYGRNALGVTGPHMMTEFIDIKQLVLSFNGNQIISTKPILTIYNTYRKEQHKYALNKYYSNMWDEKNIYNYPTLKSRREVNYARVIKKNISGKEVELYSGTPTIIEMNDSYLINIKWINYRYNEDGSKKEIPKTWISINSRFTVDMDFNKISDEIFLEEEYPLDWRPCIGLEDIRIFKYNDTYYYIATYFDNKRNVTSVSSNIYEIMDTYKLKRNIILPTMYDLNIKLVEKNWSFVKYKNELCVVYKWFPMQIGMIDYTTNLLNIIEQMNAPEYFKEARGSTCGYTTKNEIWFVLHKAQHSDKYQFNYQHFFAVFDLDMNLLRYSELFKFGDCKVEFCTGLIVKDDTVILSYSLMDTQSFVSEYTLDDINKIKWYKIESE